MKLRSIFLACMLTGALASPLACGGGADAFCDAKCDCEGCSPRQYDDCLRDYDRDQYRSERFCEYEWDVYADCIESFAGCVRRDYDEGCKWEKDRWKDCID